MLIDLDDTILTSNAAAISAARTVGLAYLDGSLKQADAFVKTWNQVRRRFWSDPEVAVRSRAEPQRVRLRVLHEALRAHGVSTVDPTDALGLYEREKDARVEVIPEAVDFLSAAQGAGLPLGLVTNGLAATQRAKLDRFGLNDYFDTVVVEDEVGFGKPNAQGVLIALQRLNLSAPRVIMIGDDLYADAGAARAAQVVFRHIDSSDSCQSCRHRAAGHIGRLSNVAPSSLLIEERWLCAES